MKLTVLGRQVGPDVDKIHVLDTVANVRSKPASADVKKAEAELRKMIRDGHARKATVISTHHFVNGIYAREVFIPAGTWATGYEHKTEHLNVLSHGEVSVMTETGMKHLKAPATFASRAGMKRFGYAHTDVVWTTFHPNPTDETEFFRLEKKLLKKPSLCRALVPCLK